jgi:hypothetical protein
MASLMGMDCGCDTRKETLGEDNFWTGIIFTGAIVLLGMTYGGNVTAQTKSVLKIAAAGAIIALIADKVVNPTVKGV